MGNARALAADLEQALVDAGHPGAGGAGLARHVQSVLQGAFILAKSQDPAQAADMAKESIGHLRRYLELLLSTIAKESL